MAETFFPLIADDKTCISLHLAIPTTKGGMQYGIYTHCIHVFCTFGADLYPQSVLIDKMSASELSRKFVKSALLVGILEICCLYGKERCSKNFQPPPPFFKEFFLFFSFFFPLPLRTLFSLRQSAAKVGGKAEVANKKSWRGRRERKAKQNRNFLCHHRQR